MSSTSYIFVLFAVICTATLCSAGPGPVIIQKGPTAPEIISNKLFIEALSKVWSESFLGHDLYQIRGGWVYADPQDPHNISISVAPPSRSKPGTVHDVIANSESVEIRLDDPDKDSYYQVHLGYKVVADFHTHPFPKVYQKPGKDDIERAYKRGVPAVVLSCSGVFYYGPERRISLAGPSGYPGGQEQYTNQPVLRYGPNPFFCQK